MPQPAPEGQDRRRHARRRQELNRRIVQHYFRHLGGRATVSQLAREVETCRGVYERLRLVAELRLRAEELEFEIVAEARRQGWYWDHIGSNLGISRQAAERKYGRRMD